MTITTTVTVTGDDIIDGVPNDPSSCPIALALKRVLELPPNGHVHTDRIVWLYEPVSDYNYNPKYRATLPHEARLFIHKFDYAKDVKPFAFELAIEEI